MNQFTIDNKIYNDIMKAAAKVVQNPNISGAKPVRAGVFVEVEPGRVAFTACDGYHMMHYVYERKNEGAPYSFIMPVLPVKRQGRDMLVIVEYDGDSHVSVTDSRTGRMITEHTIKGEYFNYRSVCPQLKHPKYIYVNAALLRSLLEDVGYRDCQLDGCVQLAIGDPLQPLLITNSSKELHMYNLLLPVQVNKDGRYPEDEKGFEGVV